jgi:hypothetical protein
MKPHQAVLRTKDLRNETLVKSIGDESEPSRKKEKKKSSSDFGAGPPDCS